MLEYSAHQYPLREDRLVLGRPVEEPIGRVAVAGSSFSFTASDVHRVLHAGEGPAVTIHAHSPPLVLMGSCMVEPSDRLPRHPVAYADELRRRDPAEVTAPAGTATPGGASGSVRRDG